MSEMKKSKFRQYISLKGFKQAEVGKQEAAEGYEKTSTPIKEKPVIEDSEDDFVPVSSVIKPEGESLAEDEFDALFGGKEEVSDDEGPEEDNVALEKELNDNLNELSSSEEELSEGTEELQKEGEFVSEEPQSTIESKTDAPEKEVGVEVGKVEKGSDVYLTVSEMLKLVEKRDRRELNPALISLEARERKKGAGITEEMFKTVWKVSCECHEENAEKWPEKASWLREFAKRRKARSFKKDASLTDEMGLRAEFISD